MSNVGFDMNHYQMVMATDSRWLLSICHHFPDNTPVDKWAYSVCQVVSNPSPVPVKVKSTGDIVDYNQTAFGVLVVSEKMADIVESLAPSEVQCIPVLFDAPGTWKVLNILNCVDCIDHNRSVIDYSPWDHAEKPRKPNGVRKLVIDPERAGDANMFRPRDWKVAEVVSERMREAFDSVGITGIEYWPVTP